MIRRAFLKSLGAALSLVGLRRRQRPWAFCAKFDGKPQFDQPSMTWNGLNLPATNIRNVPERFLAADVDAMADRLKEYQALWAKVKVEVVNVTPSKPESIL